MSKRRAMIRWGAVSDASERFLLSVLIFLVFALLILQLGTRLVGSAAFGFAEEAARYLFIWLVFLGSGFAVRRGGHIMADIRAPSPATRRRSPGWSSSRPSCSPPPCSCSGMACS